MNLTEQINQDIKIAMKAKDKDSLAALRAIKSALLLAATDKSANSTGEEAEMKMLQKLVKQRKEAAEIYQKEDRAELAAEEIQQVAIIEKYLPAQLSEEEVKAKVLDIIEDLGANSMAEMGKVMAKTNQELAGQTGSRLIANLVKEALS